MEQTIFWAIFAVVGSLIARDMIRKAKRRKSLRQDEYGLWVWIEIDGNERKSILHPDRPGGEWYSQDGGDGDGGGDGGD